MVRVKGLKNDIPVHLGGNMVGDVGHIVIMMQVVKVMFVYPKAAPERYLHTFL